MEYYVALTGSDSNDGSEKRPFRTISKAAKIAESGDIVTVHEGEYREWVKPERGGSHAGERIVYQAAAGARVVIKGSERIQNWEQVEGNVWRAVIPNDLFGDYNPYQEELGGDWFVYPDKYKLHPGEVYLNGMSFYEAASLEDVYNPLRRELGMAPPWKPTPEYVLHPEESIYQWYARAEAKETLIYANFQGADPNQELTEINVRKCCFYPEKAGLNYITVRGFEMAQAACPWTPPTADQPGLIGTHWSKGWIIEDNVIHDAKCSGISIGKEASTGHNLSTRYHRKPGYQYQMEAVFRARHIGWSKETTGSHMIRNNIIYNCGQNGIVGHMGCAFSTIEHNHIYNIAVKQEFFGYEIAGIKLHAAIDVQIVHNNIHHCTLGTWLDWQAQGTRVSKNLYYANDRDLMIEVTHGPHLVDNNIFASEYNFDNVAQGGAYVHNLCCGIMRRVDVLDRSTPYHYPHTTEVAGSAIVFSADDRLYQNIFIGGDDPEPEKQQRGTAGYNGCPPSLENYIEQVLSYEGDHESFAEVKQPAYIAGNGYLNNAPAYEQEYDHCCCGQNPQVRVYEEDGNTYLEMNVAKELMEIPSKIITGKELGTVRIVEAAFETPDGEPICLNHDYFVNKRGTEPTVGPFEGLTEGHNRICVWKGMH